MISQRVRKWDNAFTFVTNIGWVFWLTRFVPDFLINMRLKCQRADGGNFCRSMGTKIPQKVLTLQAENHNAVLAKHTYLASALKLLPMLIRIVRMHFKEEGIPEFLTIFNANKTAIRNFPGCSHLELLTDVTHPHTLTTLSHWNSEADLDIYRGSEIFSRVWAATKLQFARQPEAFSLEKFILVDDR